MILAIVLKAEDYDIKKMEKEAKKENLSVKDYIQWVLKDEFGVHFFEEIAQRMLKNAGLPKINIGDTNALAKLNEAASKSTSQQTLFDDLFSMIKNKKGRVSLKVVVDLILNKSVQKQLMEKSIKFVNQ